MNLALWTSIREYVAAEIKLALLRHQRAQPGQPWVIGEDTELRRLEEQSTRMETSVRELIERSEKVEDRRRVQDILNTPLS